MNPIEVARACYLLHAAALVAFSRCAIDPCGAYQKIALLTDAASIWLDNATAAQHTRRMPLWAEAV